MKNQALAFAFAALVGMAAAVPAYAQDYEAAGQHFASAQEAYDKGDFAKAAAEYQKAYDIAKDPVILFSIGECYDKAGKIDLAVKNYHAYLAQSPAASDRAQVERRVAELEKKPGAPAAAVTPAPATAPTTATVPATAPAPAAVPTAAPAGADVPASVAAPTKTPEDLRRDAELEAAAAKVIFDEKVNAAGKLKGKRAKKALAEATAAEERWKLAEARAEEARKVEAVWKDDLAKQAAAKQAEEARQVAEARRVENARRIAEANRAEEVRRAAAARKAAEDAARPQYTFPFDEKGSKYRTAAWVTVASTVALVGAGIIFGLVAQDRSDEVSRRMTAVGPDGQPPVFDAATQQQLKDLKSDGQSYDAVAISLLTAAGVTAITSIVLFAVDYRVRNSEKQKKRVHIAPSLAPGHAGVTAGLRF